MVKDLRVLMMRYWKFPDSENAKEEFPLFRWGTIHFDHSKGAARGYAMYFRSDSLNIHRGKLSDFNVGQRHFVCELEIS